MPVRLLKIPLRLQGFKNILSLQQSLIDRTDEKTFVAEFTEGMASLLSVPAGLWGDSAPRFLACATDTAAPGRGPRTDRKSVV